MTTTWCIVWIRTWLAATKIIQDADGSAAEIASLVVDKSYRNQGIGSKLVSEGVKEMRSGDVRLVFALSRAVSHILHNADSNK